MMTQELLPTIDINREFRTVRNDIEWDEANTKTTVQVPKPVKAPKPVLAAASPGSHRWGIVLAGGDGVRLRGLTQARWGPDRPKQFCQLLSDRTLLEETRYRAERSIPSDQILFMVTQAHKRYYARTLRDRISQTIVQPFNRGTAPAILYALIRIARTDPDAIITILPSDHYYSSEDAFSNSLESVLRAAAQHQDSVILLGARADRAETEYGWIQKGSSITGHSNLFRVEAFHEKPTAGLAEDLRKAGCLWNTFVMVGHLNAFLRMTWTHLPELMRALEAMETPAARAEEIRLSSTVYNQIPTVDFSRQFLESVPAGLLTFRLSNVVWNDLGSPYRVLVTLLEKNGHIPGWALNSRMLEPETRVRTASAGDWPA